MLLKLGTKHKQDKQKGQDIPDRSQPMPAGPIIYRADGKIDWGNMWGSFCVLALDGGPPHRGSFLEAPINPDTGSDGYAVAVAEITRGIKEVSGLTAAPATAGWLAITCESPQQALWLAGAIEEENVAARYVANRLYVPVGDQFRLKKEIKNVITAVAKTAHYWEEHLAVEVTQTLALQEAWTRLVGWVGRRFGK